jgi:Mu transposase, C-terminal domain
VGPRWRRSVRRPLFAAPAVWLGPGGIYDEYLRGESQDEPAAAGRAGYRWHRTARLPRDHYVRLDGNDYSVDPAVIGRRVEVTADLSRVRVTCDGRAAADHERCCARHQKVTDPAHLAAAKAMRAVRQLAAMPGGTGRAGRGSRWAG